MPYKVVLCQMEVQILWKDLNYTEAKAMIPKVTLLREEALAAMALKSSGAINKRSDTLTRWALSHPKCSTNMTSYVGQTAKMHCCLARLDRDLSVKNLYRPIFSMWYFIVNSFRK